MERKRREGELDGLMWFCEKCNTKLYEEKFVLNDIASQFQGVFASEKITIRNDPQSKILETLQPGKNTAQNFKGIGANGPKL
jgi:hypothetical protein